MKRASTAVMLSLAVGGCGLTAVRPKMEMSMAATAFMAARGANAQSLAFSEYRQAEYYYLKAKAFYRKKFFSKAKQYALLSQQFSERAEYEAMRKATMERY